MGCATSQDLGNPMHSTKPKNFFEGSEYELKGEYLPGKKEELDMTHGMYPNDFDYNAEWA